MRTDADISALRAACESWIGTPFCPNSAKKGAGVCCHKFCQSVYIEAGWLAPFNVPDGYPYGSQANTTSPFEAWIESSSLFADREGEMQAGDLILSKPGRLPWHLAICLGYGWFAHVDLRQGVQVTNSFPSIWASRVVKVYRPKGTYE